MSMPSGSVSPMRGARVGIEAADDLALAEPQHRVVSAPVGSTTSTRRGQRGERRLSRFRRLVIAEQVLGPHAEHHLSVRGRATVGVLTSGKRRRGRRQRCVTETAGAPSTLTMSAEMKFIDGEPMKPATNMFAGRS